MSEFVHSKFFFDYIPQNHLDVSIRILELLNDLKKKKMKKKKALILFFLSLSTSNRYNDREFSKSLWWLDKARPRSLLNERFSTVPTCIRCSLRAFVYHGKRRNRGVEYFTENRG